jgi:topoisomerase IA-like protein
LEEALIFSASKDLGDNREEVQVSNGRYGPFVMELLLFLCQKEKTLWM